MQSSYRPSTLLAAALGLAMSSAAEMAMGQRELYAPRFRVLRPRPKNKGHSKAVIARRKRNKTAKRSRYVNRHKG